MRKSTSGLPRTGNGAPVIWRSKLQTIVAQYTAEAEFIFASMAVRDILWLHELLCALRVPRQSIDLYCDNESALRLMQTESNKVCANSKHIGLQHWFIVDQIMKKDIEAKFHYNYEFPQVRMPPCPTTILHRLVSVLWRPTYTGCRVEDI
jgi:hypothetical protein